MAWRKRQETDIPPWVAHEHDGGFVASEWVQAGDFADPGVAESAARARWIAARNEFLLKHGDVADALLEQLRALVRDADG